MKSSRLFSLITSRKSPTKFSERPRGRRLQVESLEARQLMAVLLADFNGDGRDDMAVGSPNDRIAGRGEVGTVNVVYANRDGSGLSASGDQIWSQDSANLLDDAEADDRFGQALASGDFNGDGKLDMAIGISGEDLEAWGQNAAGPFVMGVIRDAGAVHVLYGTATGLSAANNQVWTQDSTGISEEAERFDEFGGVLASGDFNGDGYADLAIGVPNESVDNLNDAGMVHVLYGTRQGLSATNSQTWSQNTLPSWLNVRSERYDFFGSALAAGDISGDGVADLVIGVPGEDLDANTDSGEVNVLYGSSSSARLNASYAQRFDQGQIAGWEAHGGPEAVDSFGASLAIGDFNADGLGDLAVGVPGEDDEVWDLSSGTPWLRQLIIDVGGVDILYSKRASSTAQGRLNVASSQHWDQGTSGVVGTLEAGDHFGWTLAAGKFNNDQRFDLVVGVPGENVDSLNNSGAVNVLVGSSTGLTAAGNQLLSQNSTGVEDNSAVNEYFGSALAVGRVDGDAQSDLVVGIPGQAIGPSSSSYLLEPQYDGAVQILHGQTLGIFRTDNDRLWHQNVDLIDGTAEDQDRFGGPVPDLFDTTVPFLTSNSAASRHLVLDFDGGRYDGKTIPAFQIDNRDGMNRTERAIIRDAWETVSEDFAPFNINVTTGGSKFGRTHTVLIGARWSGRTDGASGVSLDRGSFHDPDSNLPVFVFTDIIVGVGITDSRDIAQLIGSTISHEAGHGFNLVHKSDFDEPWRVIDVNTGDGGMDGEYSDGINDWTPIMGGSLSTDRIVWTQGSLLLPANSLVYTSTDGSRTADVYAIAGSNDVGLLDLFIGTRTDDHGNTVTTATRLGSLGPVNYATGLIEQVRDTDAFRLRVDLPGTLRVFLEVNDVSPNLPGQLSLRSANWEEPGTTFSNPDDSLNANISRYVAAGEYVVSVTADQELTGNTGQYTLRIEYSVGSSQFLTNVDPVSITGGNGGLPTTYIIPTTSGPSPFDGKSWSGSLTGDRARPASVATDSPNSTRPAIVAARHDAVLAEWSGEISDLLAELVPTNWRKTGFQSTVPINWSVARTAKAGLVPPNW